MENQKLFSNDDDDNNSMFPNFGIDFPNCYFNPNWNNSGDPFESTLSSMVSSPVSNTPTASGNGDGMVLRELIGRLGSITSTNTPLNSPPKLSPVGSGGNFQISSNLSLADFSTNTRFDDKAVRYSSLGARNCEHSEHPNRWLSRGSSPDNGFEGSTVSEQIPNENGRKRKSIVKGKGKETTLPSPAKTDPKVLRESDEQTSKKRKPNEEGNEKEKKKSKAATQAEAPKDYIHVRARRGQATDSHSLAERVRREKISERMKFLQDLVPGCNKVIGKAVMLDEIINYVQSLQRQVEFLSMKLATVNPLMEFNPESVLSKDLFQLIPQNMFSFDTTFSHGYQSPQVPFSIPPLNPAPQQNMSMATTFWGDDLHSVVQNNFEQNQPQNSQNGTDI